MGKITIYYKYFYVEDPHALAKWQRALCTELGLNGRIIIAKEGINGTVGGDEKQVEIYKERMHAHPFFAGLDFKDSPGEAYHFPRLSIKIKDEIVHLGLDTEKIKATDSGKHLSPDEAHAFMAQEAEDVVVFDTRNTFEWKIGQFSKHAVNADIEYFRELPEFIEKNSDLFKDKRVLMACTAGVRCERASAFLKSTGIAKEVYQFDGGIHKYAEKYPDGFFRGKNYVFDGRVAVKINDDVVGTCEMCGTAYDDHINCINAECNKQILACEPCQQKYGTTCSERCATLVKEGKVNIRTKPQRVLPPTANDDSKKHSSE